MMEIYANHNLSFGFFRDFPCSAENFEGTDRLRGSILERYADAKA
jgi:hypothetical protein